MIRNGLFGTNFEIKFILAILGIIICLYDWKKNKRKDYPVVFLYGSLFWFAIEFIIQLQGTRDIITATLFGKIIPMWFAALLRGISEGGLIALIGLFFGDRIFKKVYVKDKKKLISRILFAVFLILIVVSSLSQALPFKDINGDVASRRLMFNPSAMFSLSLLFAFIIFWAYKADNKAKLRSLYMFLIMVIASGIWTIAEVFANTRWIELGTARAPFIIEFLVLSFDVVIEIALLYVPFFAIPYLLGWIKKE